MVNQQPSSRPASGPTPGESTTAVQAGEQRMKPGYSVTEPIFPAATYSFPDTKSLVDFIVQKQARTEYARYGNPTEKTAEQKLAAVEGAEECVLYSTGMSALAGVFLTVLQSGDEIILFDECYQRTRDLCAEHLSRFGISTRYVRTNDFAQLEAAITPNTKLLVSESPTNPHLTVVDLPQFAAVGQKHGIDTLIDATMASPYNVRPLSYGITYVVHSCTKYLAGHNDLLAGAVLGSRQKLEPLRKFRGLAGMINSPQNEYLLIRGLKTLELRMQRHNENGLAVARFLETHPRIERVFYPGLPSHPSHEIARRTMRGFGGVVTFVVKDADWRQAAAVVDSVRIPRIAPSLGGVESLIEQPYVLGYFETPAQQRAALNIPDAMIRLACGIENAEDLIADLDQALR